MGSVGRFVAALAAVLLVVLASHSTLLGQDDDPILRLIVVATPDVADRIRAQVEQGESFALLAVRESTDATAAEGGWLGRVPRGQLRPEVQAAIAGLRPGQVSHVVRIPTGYALFRLEPPDADTPVADEVAPGLAAAGAVKFVYDFGGFSEARASLEAHARSRGWQQSSHAACDERTHALATTRRVVDEFLASGGLASRTPLDIMQLHVGLAQLDAYEGRMSESIARLESALRIAVAEIPEAVPSTWEALGIAHLHKAGLDNHVHTEPGDLCLLDLAAHRYPDTTDVERAIDYFLRYLEARPDDYEVRWLLNVAHMAAGTFPDRVPDAFRLPPEGLASAEDVGRFRDVAREAGLVSVGSAGGLIVEDLFGRGTYDVVTSMAESCGAMRLFTGNGDGTFTDRTAGSGLEEQMGGLNLVLGDYDNNGCGDILVLRGGWEELPQRRSLLRNNCDGTFTDVTEAAGLADPPTASQTAVFVDIDNDGWLDLFIGNERSPSQLFRNRGDGTFEDVSVRAGVARTSYTKGVAAGDYDNDGFADLYVSNYGETNFLYRNNGDGTFTDVTGAARVRGTRTSFATWFFDYDNDGWQDLFVASYVASLDDLARRLIGLPRIGTTMKLYRNLGDGTFADATVAAGLDRVLMPMGANYGDIDNDGWLDIYLGTGNPSYASLAGSVLLRNRGGREFVDVTAASGTGELHRGHGVAFADLDDDGDQEIVFEVGGITPGDRHALRLFENPGHGNGWLAIRLVGRTSNRSAVGARVAVTVEDPAGGRRTIHRTVSTGGSFGVSPLVVHVGLGTAKEAAAIDVWWPASGIRQRFQGVAGNRKIVIEEGAERFEVVEPRPTVLSGGRR